MLNDTAWVPDGSGGLQPPNRVEFEPLGWRPDRFLEPIIKFRQPEPPSKLTALSAEVGVDRDALEAVKEAQDAGLSPEEIRQTLRREARRQRIVAGPTPDSGGASARGGAGAGVETPGEGAIENVGAAGDGYRPGNTGVGPASGGERVFESYIRVERESAGTAEGSREHERRMGVEEEAIALIQKQEPALKGTPANNPGFDLYEVGEGGEPLRWIEVKALAEGWESRPVTLTHTQFDYARAKGEAYWLYVVEHVGTDHAAIVKINDPAGWESTYAFDKGWRVAAEPQ